MTSRLEKRIKEMDETDIPGVVVAVAKRYGLHIDTGNDDIGQRYGYELRHKGLSINVSYSGWDSSGWDSSSYARATINGKTVFSGERFWNVTHGDDRSSTYITRSKPRLKQLEKLLVDVCRKHQRKK